MSKQTEEFSLIAVAERQLCDVAESVFAPIIRAVKAQAGLCITEVRVTFDPAVDSDASVANCTIVGAHATVPAAHLDIRHTDDAQHATDSTRVPSAGSSASQA